MKNNGSKFSITIKSCLISSILFALPLIVIAKGVFIKDSNNSANNVSCDYKSLTISESGNMEIILNNYQACVNTTLPVEPQNTDCLFEGVPYSKGTTKTFYKSKTNCSDSLIATCGNDAFPPNGYSFIECQDKPTTSAEGWLPDPHSFGSNKTSQDLYANTGGSPEGFKVYTLDAGISVPQCANNKPAYLCSKAGDWFPGAKTNEVYAVREKKIVGSGINYQFRNNVAGGKDVQQAVYDVTLSGNPGQMNTSTFGQGCVHAGNTLRSFDISLLSDKRYEQLKNNLPPTACYIPKGATYYINIRAATPSCDQIGEPDPNGRKKKNPDGTIKLLDKYKPCSSYYEKH